MDIEQQKSLSLPSKPKGWGARHTLAVLGFWAFAISYAMRFNLSLAIVAMVNRTSRGPGLNLNHIQISDTNETLDYENETRNSVIQNVLGTTCPHHQRSQDSTMFNDNETTSDSNVYESDGEFNWNEAEQGFILGSFFWGYLATQLPGGLLAARFGGKWPLGIGLLITAIFTLLTPWAARTHISLLIFVRVMQGVGEGVGFPAMHTILASWAPPDERSKLGSIIYAGAQFGTAATMVLSGYLIVNIGWPSVFYVIGTFSVGWFVLWALFMHNTPGVHPRISSEELTYIEKSLGNQSTKLKVATPWRKIATSMPVWAIVVADVGHAWGLYTLLTELPTYLKTVLHFDMTQNSWISALPYLVMWIASITISQIADAIIERKTVNVVVVRKTCQTIAHVGSALALIGASYSGCDRTTTIALLTISVGMNGGIYGGYIVNHLDIAPNHAGILFGITNTICQLTGFGAPYVAGLLVNNDPSIENWQYVFFIAAAIYFVDAIFFAMYASGVEQPWNRGQTPEDTSIHDEEAEGQDSDSDDDDEDTQYAERIYKE